MFTRAYDAILDSFSNMGTGGPPCGTPPVYSNSELGGMYINCKDTSGTVRNRLAPLPSQSISAVSLPMGLLYASTVTYGTTPIFGTNGTAESYEDYTITSSGLTISKITPGTSYYSGEDYTKYYLPYTITAANNSASAVTISEVGFQYTFRGIQATSAGSFSSTGVYNFLVWRKAITPVTVQPSGMLSVTVTLTFKRHDNSATV